MAFLSRIYFKTEPMEIVETDAAARSERDDKLKELMSRTIHIEVASGQQCYW